MAPSTPKHLKGEKGFHQRKDERMEELVPDWVCKHHCGDCHKPGSNETTPTTCLGYHSEVCKEFHQTLHYIDASPNCTACREAAEARYRRHDAIANAIADLNTTENEAPSSSTKKSAKERPVVRVGEKEISRVATAMQTLFYQPVANIDNVEAAQSLQDDNFEQIKDKKWKPVKVEATMYPDVNAKANHKVLKRHARVYAAFGLGLMNKGGNAKAHAASLDKFWNLIRQAKQEYENDQKGIRVRKLGYQAWAGSAWRNGLPKGHEERVD